MNSYFFLCLILAAVWLAVFFLRPDLRSHMLRVSALLALLGPLSEVWFLRDYWQRATSLGSGIGPEDILFSFFICGIAFSLPKLLGRYGFAEPVKSSPNYLLIFLAGSITLASLLLGTNVGHINSIFSSAAAFWLITLIIWKTRPDLIALSLLSGFILTCTMVIAYNILEALHPGILLSWCLHCNPTGIRLLNINIEELIWDFSWGALGGIIYDAASNMRVVRFPIREEYRSRPSAR